jgi:hypothetical protein
VSDLAERVEEAQARLGELQARRDELDTTRTTEDLRRTAADWLAATRARTSGLAAGYVLNGAVAPEHLGAVVAGYVLDDKKFADWLVAKLEQFDQSKFSDVAKARRLAALDKQITEAKRVFQEARVEQAKAEAAAAVEAELGPA